MKRFEPRFKVQYTIDNNDVRSSAVRNKRVVHHLDKMSHINNVMMFECASNSAEKLHSDMNHHKKPKSDVT